MMNGTGGKGSVSAQCSGARFDPFPVLPLINCLAPCVSASSNTEHAWQPKSVTRLKRADLDHFVASDDDSPHSSSDSPTADCSSPAEAAAAHAHVYHQQQQEEQQNGGKHKGSWARGRAGTATKLHITAPQSPQSAPAGMAGGHFDPTSPRPSSSSQKQCPSSPGSRQLPASASASSHKCPFSPRQAQHHPPQGPRMPDGTRGFTMGRGKPTSPPAAAAVLV